MDWFCGAGGSTQGASKVPGVRVTRAANHWEAVETHAANYPEADHFLGDLSTEDAKAQIVKWPVADIFWASPECPQWSSARGKKRDYDNTLQGDLLDLQRDEEADRSRALMEEVPMYLRGVIGRGGRVRAAVVENVVEVRQWDQWSRWIGEIRALGYGVKVIALNSAHAQPVLTSAARQSRDRLYVAYWDLTLGREPDWNKWLRPLAFCVPCDEWVHAIQVFKKPNADMGRYRTQYTYRCPRISCRNSIVEPPRSPGSRRDRLDLARYPHRRTDQAPGTQDHGTNPSRPTPLRLGHTDDGPGRRHLARRRHTGHPPDERPNDARERRPRDPGTIPGTAPRRPTPHARPA